MPDLLAQPELVTAEAPRPGVSPSQVAQPYFELSQALEKGGQASEAVAENAATRAGYQAVTTDEHGNVQIQKAPIIGPASNDYERAVKMAALAQGEGAAKDADITLRQKFEGDPQGYLTAANAYKNGVMKQYAELGVPEVGIALGRAIDSTTTYNFRALSNQKRELDLRNAASSIDAGISSARDELVARARGGDLSSPQFVQALDKVRQLTNEKTNNPLFAYPKEKAQYDLDQLDSQLRASSFLFHVDSVYHDTSAKPDGSARGGAGPALEAARSVLTDPSLKLDESQRQQYYNKAVAEVHANEAMRRQDVQEARIAEQGLNTAMMLGGKVDPEDVEQVATAYRMAGAPQDAARLYAKYARKPLGDDFTNKSLPDQVSELRALQSGANPTSGAEARLIAHESSGIPTKVNQFGFAGLYQFGAPLLKDLGLYTPGPNENIANWNNTPANAGGKWSGTFNIPGFPEVKTLQDFLRNPAAQKAAYDVHAGNMDQQIQTLGLDKYEGQTVAGVPITHAGLQAMIHLAGAEGARVALQTGGRIQAADANGTTPLAYAAMAAHGAQPNPGASLWLAANRSSTISREAEDQWKTVMADYNKIGVRPANVVISQIIDAAHATNDHGLLEQIAADTNRMDATRAELGQSLPMQSAVIGTLQTKGQAGELTPGQGAVLKDLEQRHNALIKGLEENPISTAATNSGGRFSVPTPLDFSDPQKLAAGLQQRVPIARFANQTWQGQPVAALDAADVQAARTQLANPDPAVKAQIYGAIATLPEDLRGPTLAKIAGSDPSKLAEAAAGSMMRSSPDVATSIMRGLTIMGKDDKGILKAFEPTGKGAGFTADFTAALPATAFPLQSRTDPSGPYSTIGQMVKARYADLSAQVGDTNYSKERVTQAVNDVTGGVLSMNGGSVIAPARGMTQSQFDGVLAGITDRDLAGVTTLNGQPITPGYLRGNARLESVGEGRYLVTLGRNQAAPVYAYQGANTEAPSKFVLDLRGRAPGPLNFSVPTVAVAP